MVFRLGCAYVARCRTGLGRVVAAYPRARAPSSRVMVRQAEPDLRSRVQ